ncbi:hypothetical protein F5878DRAFT_616106 [Lentinula raphanica]|uniref:Uncharacterized protein n=1 Tax=Lentinula raphanica TaxID=153919 RepID=A0AA38PBD6_9AGAR|nr:hypothetical protein F5878DRAFT_616106 [Lentinula raphanica]
MRLSASSFFTSRRLALSLCFFSSIAVMVIAWIPIDPQLSGAYPIYLSEILDKEGQSTGMRFIEINDARFGKERTVLQRQLPTSPPKVIGSVSLSAGLENLPLTEAREHAEHLWYPQPQAHPFNSLAFIGNYLEHLRYTNYSAIPENEMASIREELKRLRTLNRESKCQYFRSTYDNYVLNGSLVVVLIEDRNGYSSPTGKVSMQVGDDVLTHAPWEPTNPQKMRGFILGPVSKERVDHDKLRQHAESHSGYCGTEKDVERFQAKQKEIKQRGRGAKSLEWWRVADGVVDGLRDQQAESEEILKHWDKLCPGYMNTFINTVDYSRTRSDRSQPKRDKTTTNLQPGEDSTPGSTAKKQKKN